MEDGDTEVAVGVDVGVVERAGELEGWWGVGVVAGEGHGGENVAGVVEGVGVKDYETDLGGEYFVVFELEDGVLVRLETRGRGGLLLRLPIFRGRGI